MRWDDTAYRAFDFETGGTLPEYRLQPHRVARAQAWVTSWATAQFAGSQVATRGEILVGRSRDEVIERLRHVLTEAIADGVTMVGWNMQFDVAWFQAYRLDDLVRKLRWLDGMLLWRHWFIEPEYDTDRHKKRSYSLKVAVAEEWPQAAGYEEDVDFDATDPDSLAKLLKYNRRDTAFTLLLTRKYYRLLAQEPRRLRAALIEARAIPAVAKSSLLGVPVDVDHAKRLVAELEQRAGELLCELEPHGVDETVVRSPKKLAQVLFEQWRLQPIAQTSSGAPSTDKATLHELAFVDQRAKLLREYRETLNGRSKFPVAILESVDYNGDGRTRPAPRVFGTYTSRLTYASKQGRNKDERPIGFALHQMKRGAAYRSQIVAPYGYELVEFDAAGQEFRWMAILSDDATMLDLCLPGEDPHSFMGARITGLGYKELVEMVHSGHPTGKPSRQLGKVANLSLQYRTSANKLRTVARVDYDIPMELPQARAIHRTYQRSYPGVPRYWQRQIEFGGKHGYVETLAGRRVQLTGSIQDWRTQSTCINYPVQGTGGDQKYLALAVLDEYCVKRGIHFAWDLHDGIYFYVPKDIVYSAARDMRRMLNNLPYKGAWGFAPPIPLPWDVKIGASWGELQEWNDDA